MSCKVVEREIYRTELYIAVDDLLRHSSGQPGIGLILCKSRNRVIVEYALRDMHRPIGVSTYQLT